MGSMPGQMPMGGGMPGQMSMAGGVPVSSMGGMAPGMYPGMHHGGQVPIQGVQPSVMPIVSNPMVQQAVAPPAPAEIPWLIPQPIRVKSSQMFQANDRARTGFLAAVQARNLLLQTGLAQQTLAGVWNLADIDKDGKLNTEEFCLAMHLCEVAMKGEPLPAMLPVSLVPPSMRRAAKDAGVIGTPGSQGSGMHSPASFEDKRKDNWEKGQEELNRRRESLVAQQQQEKAERVRKEKVAAEEREKKKREVEAKKAAELEARRAREVELRRVQEEQRRAARKEMEVTRLKEWEKSRATELEAHRQRETESVIALRAKKETLVTDAEGMKTKVEELTKGIADTRAGVTDVKSFIDGMRSSRDTKMAELNALKAQLKEQNQRLLAVTQDKARLEARNKVNQMKEEEGIVVELTDFDLKKNEKLKQA